jgi:hypothetical protein
MQGYLYIHHLFVYREIKLFFFFFSLKKTGKSLKSENDPWNKLVVLNAI